jgi:signal transduction histidine kinase
MGMFSSRINLTENLDEIDAFISGVNMLGEELKTTTISRNYFNNIFHSVSDLIIVLNEKGIIENVNRSAVEKLNISASQLIGLKIDQLLEPGEKSLFSNIRQSLERIKSAPATHHPKPQYMLASGAGSGSSQGFETELKFRTSSGSSIPLLCSCTYLLKEGSEKPNYLLTLRDLSRQKEIENLVIRTINDTQEKERIRVAKDLHDSLGQQLSAVKFYLGTLINTNKNADNAPILKKSDEALTTMLTELRNICFNLMPKTLEQFGLIESVHELCRKTEFKGLFEFNVRSEKNFPTLDKSLEIAIFRIIQEFISNAIKHGKATKIKILFNRDLKKGKIKIELKENGKGFDIVLANTSAGMGLKNVRSRVRSYNGEVKISSAHDKGTEYIIQFPYK